MDIKHQIKQNIFPYSQVHAILCEISFSDSGVNSGNDFYENSNKIVGGMSQEHCLLCTIDVFSYSVSINILFIYNFVTFTSFTKWGTATITNKQMIL